jgi:small-conductance mechanosensitive channel
MQGKLLYLGRTFLLVMCFLLPLQAAENTFTAEALDALSKQLDSAEKEFQQYDTDITRLESLTTTATELGQKAQACISQYEQEQTQTQQASESLGTSTATDDTEVKRKRTELEAQKQQADKTLSQCRLISLRANTLLESARKSRQDLLKQQLFAPSDSLFTHLYIILLEPDTWKRELEGLINKLLQPLINWYNLIIALSYGLAGLIVGLFWSTHKRRQYRAQTPAIHETSPTLAAVWRSLLRVMPYVLFAGLSGLSLYFHPAGTPIIPQFIQTLLVFSLSYGILHSLLRTTAQVDGIMPADKKASNRLYIWARLLLFSTMTGVVIHSQLFDSTSLENPEPSHLIALLRIACGTLVGIALIRLIWLMSTHFLSIKRIRLHLLTALVITLAIGSLWLGYRNFSSYLFTGVFGTLFLLLTTLLLINIPAEIFDGLDEGKVEWQQRLRHQLGLKAGQFVPGLIWLRLTNTLVIYGLLVILLLRLWGMSEQSQITLLNQLSNGIHIAGFTLEPLRIIGGLLALALLVSLTQVFKKHFSESWLRRTTLSRGAREASTTISGYIGILLSILVGLSVAGIQFEKLAIIAGALSVGIGFGLQNIVNNFVSGLILLFERPIRRGDWIKVGTAEGYVREISIRSTTIQTFDRSDIIVPNSEIISGQVTNMMLNDNFGRLILPIGVAYGSDTAQVMVILREAATTHPAVLKERTDMKISVFFRGFGADSLDFELRCFIRDIESKLSVTSDINLAIDKAFRQQGIDIPFPQRTLHLAKGSEVPAKSPDLG